MRILADISHPAHVHLFRNAIRIWMERGHSVVIAIRDKDITAELLDLYGFPYTVASVARRGLIGMAIELVERDWRIAKLARASQAEVLIGTSIPISHVARVVGAKSIVFNEDDVNTSRIFAILTYPFAHCIVTPTCLNENYGPRHVKYNGYQKLAYLHPNVFTPNPAIRARLGVRPEEPYFVMRFSAFQAAHDRGEAGLKLETRRRLIRTLTQRGPVFVTSEAPLPEEFEPYRVPISPVEMHDALAFATLFIGDSQSMTVEAAVLGVPAIRCSTFARRCSVLQELEHKYGLTYGFLPEQEEEMFAKIGDLLNKTNLREEWQQKRARMLADKIDVTAWMVDFVERYPDSLHEYVTRG